MKRILLVLALSMVFLSLSNEAEATNDGDIIYGSDVALAFNTSRQPNINNPTLVTASVRIVTPLLSTETTGLVSYQISPNNSTWSTISEHYLNADVAGLGITLQQGNGEGTTFIVSKGYYYRILVEPLTGSPTFTLRELHEAEMDVFEYDPLSDISCSQLANPGDQVYCGFTAYHQNQTVRNDLNYTVTIFNETLSTIQTGSALNSGSFGKYRFNFTSQATPQTYEITVNNTNLSYAKSFWIESNYLGLTADQNATLYDTNNKTNLLYNLFFVTKTYLTEIATTVWAFIFDNGKTSEQTILDIENNTQYIIEQGDDNTTQILNAIDNVNMTVGNLTINQTAITVAIAPRQKCLGLC